MTRLQAVWLAAAGLLVLGGGGLYFASGSSSGTPRAIQQDRRDRRVSRVIGHGTPGAVVPPSPPYVPYFSALTSSGVGVSDVCAGTAIAGNLVDGGTVAITQNTAADGVGRTCMMGNWFTGIKTGDVATLTADQPRVNLGINGTGTKGITGYDERWRVNHYPNFELDGGYWTLSASSADNNYVGAGAVDGTSDTPGNPTPGLPALWHPDDIFVAVLGSSGTIGGPYSWGTVTTPTGWNLLVGPTDNESANYGIIDRVYWRRAVAGDTAPTFVNTGGEPYGEAVIVAYRGAITSGNPFEAVGTNSIQTASTTSTAPAITTLTANARVIVIHALNYSATLATPGTSAFTGSPTPTWRVYATTPPSTNYNAVTIADFTMAAPGTTGNRSATIVSAPSNAVMLALTITSPGGAVAVPTLTRDVGLSPRGIVEASRMVTPAAAGTQFAILKQLIGTYAAPTSASYHVKGCIDGADDGGCVEVIETSDPHAPLRLDGGPAIGLDGGHGEGTQGFAVGADPYSCVDVPYVATTWTRGAIINAPIGGGGSAIFLGSPAAACGNSYGTSDVLIWQSDYQTCETIGPPIMGEVTNPQLTLAENYTAPLTLTGNSRCFAENALTAVGLWVDGTELMELYTDASNAGQAKIYSNKLRCLWKIGGVTSSVDSASTVSNGVDHRLACLYDGTTLSSCVDGTCTPSTVALTLPNGAVTLHIGGGVGLTQPTGRESNSSKNYNVIVDQTATGCSP